MFGLYTKLREIGHGRTEAASRALSYYFAGFAPFPSHTPVELQIEEQLTTLEYIAGKRYKVGNRMPSQRTVDILVGYLDNQMHLDEGKRFSKTQGERYKTVLNQLADLFPMVE